LLTMSAMGEEAEKVEDVDFSEELEEEEGAPNADTQAEDPPAEAEAAEEPAADEAAAATEQASAPEAAAQAEPTAANGEPAAEIAAASAAADASTGPEDSSKTAAAKVTGGGADPLEEPPHGSEVFVGGIPKTSTVTDEQLLEFATEGGEVYSCAVLKDPGSGQNRGYGFIKFKSKEIAQKAMAKLNDTEMKDHPGFKIRVLPSQSKNRLYLGNLPKEMTKDNLEATIKAATKGLEKVELLMSKDWPGQNRGFCFLEFYNHACAQAAKAALSPPNFQLGNKPLTITFAEPRRADTANDDQTQQIKSIFVGNLPDTANEAKLRELFAPLGEITRAFIPAPRDGKTRREFGFVHFQDRASVLTAISNHDNGDKVVMDGTPLEVKLGRVYHENPPAARNQQGGFQQGNFGGRGRGVGGQGMGARFGGRMGGGYQQQGGRMGGMGGYGGGYGDYGQYGGGMAGMGGMEGGYGGYGGGEEYYDDGSYGSYGAMGMGAMAAGGIAGGGAGMSMVPMMLPNGQVGYVLSNAGAAAGAGGMAAGGMAGGGMAAGGMAAGSGMGGPMRGRGYGAGGQAGGYGATGRGRGGGYGGRGSAYGGQQRYAPY